MHATKILQHGITSINTNMKTQKNIIKDVQFTQDIGSSGNLIKLDGGRGYKTNIPVCKVGIQEYMGYEVDSKRFGYDAVVRVYRPEEEVSDPVSMATLDHIYLTNEHPYEDVDVENASEYVIGEGGSDYRYDFPYIYQTLYIKHSDGIAALVADKREVSMGYVCDLEIIDGTYTDENGAEQRYQAIQRNIKYNHCALVLNGRMNSTIRIGDKSPVRKWCLLDRASKSPDKEEDQSESESKRKRNSNKKDNTMETVKVLIGKKKCDVAEKHEDYIVDFLDTMKTDHESAMATLQSKLDDATELHTKALEDKEAEITELKESVLDEAELDKAIAEKIAFDADCKAIAPDVDLTGKNKRDSMIAVIAKLLPKKAFDEKTAIEMIESTFDNVKEFYSVDAKRNAVKPVDKLAGKVVDTKTITDAAGTHFANLLQGRKPQDKAKDVK